MFGSLCVGHAALQSNGFFIPRSRLATSLRKRGRMLPPPHGHRCSFFTAPCLNRRVDIFHTHSLEVIGGTFFFYHHCHDIILGTNLFPCTPICSVDLCLTVSYLEETQYQYLPIPANTLFLQHVDSCTRASSSPHFSVANQRDLDTRTVVNCRKHYRVQCGQSVVSYQ